MDKVFKNEYAPDYVSPPGDTLLEILESQGIKQVTLSERIGRSKKFINEIVRGKENITPGVALQLERVLGIPSSFWNNRQKRYDDYLARIKEKSSLREQLAWVKNFPYKKMSNLNWVDDTQNKMERLINLLDFFRVASPYAWDKYLSNLRVSFRKSSAFKSDIYALAAWLRKGEINAELINCQPYDENKFKAYLPKIRQLTVERPQQFQNRLVELCALCGVAVTFVRELPKTASGATRWLKPNKALLQLSLRYKTDDHLWFTFFHEAGHLLLHKKRKINIEDGHSKDDIELEANRFAEEILIPKKLFNDFAQKTHFSKVEIQSFAQPLGISPGIVVGRLQNKGKLPKSYCNDLKRKFKWAN